MGEAPTLMTLVYTSTHESLVCVGYKHQFDLISEAGDVSRIHSIDKQKVLTRIVEFILKVFLKREMCSYFFFCLSASQKATLVSAVDVYEEEESELLVSFNRKSNNIHMVLFNWSWGFTRYPGN